MSSKRSKVDASSSASDDASDADFGKLEKALKAFDEKREVVIKKSRDVQKAAKQAIYSIQRLDISKANSLLSQCEDISNKDIFPLVNEDSDLRPGSFTNAIEEYVEAILFKHFCENSQARRPMLFDEVPLKINAEEYLGGLMDCCGEIQRRAVLQATKGAVEEVERCREYVDYTMGRVLLFDFRNGSLRKKSDSIKWVLKRIEEVLFDLKVGGRMKSEVPAAAAPAPSEGE